MYLCDDCGAIFEAPMIQSYSEPTPVGRRIYTEQVCPSCANADTFQEVDKCKCGGWKYSDEIMCKACRVSFRIKLLDFLNTLTYEEEQQMDEWLDGNSVTDRGAFI